MASSETTTHRVPAKVFKPYPAINKPTFNHDDAITIIEAARVVEITEKSKQKPKSFSFTDDFFDRYYKDGWKDTDVKNSEAVPDFVKFARPMPISQRRMDVRYFTLNDFE